MAIREWVASGMDYQRPPVRPSMVRFDDYLLLMTVDVTRVGIVDSVCGVDGLTTVGLVVL